MKKMNFSRLGKMLLPVFFLFGLFLLSTNTVNAQTHKDKLFAEKVEQHVKTLPNPLTVGLPSVKSDVELANNPQLKDKLMGALERQYGILIIYAIKKGDTAREAIDRTYKSLNQKIDAAYLDPVKETYLGMLE